MIAKRLETDNTISNAVRTIPAWIKLEPKESGTGTIVATHRDRIKSFSIDRIGNNSRFFGFAVSHKLNIKLIDKDREIDAGNLKSLCVEYRDDTAIKFQTAYYPQFIITEINRDENTNELSITAYDAIYFLSQYTFSQLGMVAPYTIRNIVEAIVSFMDTNISSFMMTDRYINADASLFDLEYPEGANLDGTESLRSVLDAIAEATQTIYYLDYQNYLTFKRLDKDGEAVLTIGKEDYFNLDSKTNRRLSVLTHTTELGDAITASLDASGTTQYIRDNPFYELREDTATLLDNALLAMGGLTINQFMLDWRGNYLLEIGDKIAITTKDNNTAYSYLLDDTITYDGTLSQKTQWEYAGSDIETANNPTSLGDALNKTFARVDKVNNEINIVAGTTNENAQAISSLQLNTESINASVQSIRDETADTLEGLNSSVNEITTRLDTTITSENMSIAIAEALEDGVSKVETSTGFVFDADGLRVSKTDSEMETQITEDGMTVAKNGEVMLTANNIGVNAVNLHATTYLIIGTNSRFEDYGNNRTGCFWIGGE